MEPAAAELNVTTVPLSCATINQLLSKIPRFSTDRYTLIKTGVKKLLGLTTTRENTFYGSSGQSILKNLGQPRVLREGEKTDERVSRCHIPTKGAIFKWCIPRPRFPDKKKYSVTLHHPFFGIFCFCLHLKNFLVRIMYLILNLKRLF